jgi:DNA-binding NtrC family response regulator
MSDKPGRDWKTLAERAATEQDPTKLLEIVSELNGVLLERERQRDGKSLLKRVLVVDDDPNLRLTLLPILNSSGFDARMVSTIPDALHKIEANRWEILICDLNITEPEDGFKIISAMKKAHPRSVIVLLTGHPAFDSAVKAIGHEIDSYVVKPADYDALIRFLEERLLAKRSLR